MFPNSNALFQKLFPQTFKREGDLPNDLINAVQKYNLAIHQQIIKDWIDSTPNKNNIRDKDGNSILHLAAMAGKKDLVLLFINKGVKVNAQNEIGDSPLIATIIEADKNKEKPEIRKRLLETIDKLLEKGAENVPNRRSLAPKCSLCVAATCGDLDVVKKLVTHGFDVNESDVSTPLWWAKNSKNRTPELIDFLISKGAKEDVDLFEQKISMP